MRNTMKSLVAMLAVLMAAGCDRMEKEFAESGYGMEMRSMVETCMNMSKNGDLPGIEGGEDQSLEFSSEEMDFSEKDGVSYPLRLKCMIAKGEAPALTFTFNRETADTDWALVP